jgi:hypothetical protein
MARKTPSQDHQRVQSRGDAGEPADHRTASRSASPSPLNHGIDPEAYAVGYRRPPLHGSLPAGAVRQSERPGKAFAEYARHGKTGSQRGYEDPRGRPFAPHVYDGSSGAYSTRTII